MKFIALFSATMAAGVIAAQAATAPSMAATTNANSEAAMTALFGDPAVAKGNGFEIKRSDLDEVVSGARANAAASGQQLPPEFDASVLGKLITIQVLLQTANADDHATGKQEADEQYTNLLQQFSSPEAFERQLKAVGMTVTELRAKAAEEATAKAALKRVLKITTTEDDARDFYAKHPADFEQPEQVHARHILLMTIDPTTHQPLDTNAIAAKRKLIEELRRRILAGEDFATLAKQYSEDGSKDDGGDLGVFGRGRMVAEFESAAFALGTNEVSDVVTSPYGFHLIKVLEKFPAKKIDFATAELKIKDYLSGQQIAKLAPDYIKKLRADQQVDILDSNLKAQDVQIQAQADMAAAEAQAAGTNK